MYAFEIVPSCEESIRKKCRKNRPLQEAIDSKVAQILEKPYAFKPLKAPLDGTRRVHIGPFVLIYEIDEKMKVVRLVRFAHHDEAY